MKVSLIMPVRNEARSAAQTMESVFCQTRRPDEIVIGDGCSTDGTVELIRGYAGRGIPIKIEQESMGYIGAGRNVAIEAATHEVIAAADFGTVLDCRWLEEIVRPLECDPTVDMVAGLGRPVATTVFEKSVAAITQPTGKVDELSKRALPDKIIAGGTSVAFRKDIWRRAGGFPEWIKTGEDKLFARRVHRIGGRVVGALRAVVYCELRDNLWKVYQQSYSYGKGNAQSHQISRNFANMLLKYAAGLLLLVLGFISPIFWLIVVAGFALHVYRSGFARYRALDGGLGNPKVLMLVPVVLLTRNIASFLGHGAGYYDWLTDPRYKRKYFEYMEGRKATSNEQTSPALR